MNPVTDEWVEKAEGDYHSGQREYRARKNPNYADVCFHAQQCVEKYRKGYMQQKHIPYGKTHDLLALLKSILPGDPEWMGIQDDLDALTPFAMMIRYPGESADKATAKDCLLRMKRVRTFIRRKLGLD
jgi:HEPN domain-containing protein